MKLITFERGGVAHIGALQPAGDEVVDFTARGPAKIFSDMLALIDSGPDGLAEARERLDQAREVVALADVRLLAPLPVPRQMRDFIAYEKHLRQGRANRYLLGEGSERVDPETVHIPEIWYRRPCYYKCNRFAVSGPDATILWPYYTDFLDYELELGFVIGRSGKNIRIEDARGYIFGFTIFNDISARDVQISEMSVGLGPAKGKDFDTSNVIGPWITTIDDIIDPYNLVMTARVNGEEWSRGNTGEIAHTFEAMIAHVSSEETLYPGEFFGTGTVGSGCGLEQGRFLQPGDVVELEIEELGVLRSYIGMKTGARGVTDQPSERIVRSLKPT